MKTQTIKKTLLVLAAAAFAWAAWKAPAQETANLAAGPQLSDGALQVLKLEQAKVSDGTVIAYINNSPSSYALNAEQIIYLRQNGVSDTVITAMLTQSRAGVAPAPLPQTSPAPEQSYYAPTPTADPPVVAPATAPTAVTYVQSSPTYYYPNYYPNYAYSYPAYGYYGWPFSWVWWGGGWHWGWGGHGGGWSGGWHGGTSHGGGWGGGGWHGGGGAWHGGGGGHFGGGHR
jgi:hypothetical protein